MPNTIADNLQRLVNARTAISNAITAKGGTVTVGDGYEEFPADIATIPSGGGGGADAGKPVRFIDYDGSVVDSYTAAEFAELSAMPSNPSHEGLTAQGWNWSLADAKAYVTEYGHLNIGQMYITSDGKTRIYITLQDGRTSPILTLYLYANTEVDVDWGDGSPHTTWTSIDAGYQNERHAYTSAGDYIIVITVVNGNVRLVSSSSSRSTLLTNGDNSISSPDRAYLNSIQKVSVGSSVTSIGDSVFSRCSSLTSITIPDSVMVIGNYAFYQCSSLTSITIPDSITSIGNYAFSQCPSLTSITIPDSITSIGDHAFSQCSSLTSITIPDSVMVIGNYAFYQCSSLTSITIPDSITSIGNYAFSQCPSLTSITIPDSVMVIGNFAFSQCPSLTSITIPDSITSIGDYTFTECYSLASVTINKVIDAISGSPWGANTSTPTFTQIIWNKTGRFKFATNETSTGTSLTTSVNCNDGDLVVATFVVRSDTYTISNDWTLLGISDSVGSLNQKTGLAYKIAESTNESITVTQGNSARIYTNVVSITGASIGTFSGFTTKASGYSVTLNKPSGLVLWAVSSSLWGTTQPYMPWEISNSRDTFAIELPTSSQPRCLTALDQSSDESITFTCSLPTPGDAALAAASLTITGIPDFWYDNQ